jgi:NADPH-dependent 2,4-dienoyl-CoA reductase/sulfur reductase-like enzyme
MSGGGHVAIVGAGPAGLMAAVEAHRRGARVTLIDEAPRPGGQIYRQPHPNIDPGALIPPGEAARKDAVLGAFSQIAGDIDYRAETTAYAAFPGPELHIADEEGSAALRPDTLVLATGVSERAVPFPGWTLPGIMYAGGLQALLKEHGVVPPGRIMIVGAGPLPVAVAAQLVRAGAEVVGVALLRGMTSMLRHPLALWHGRDIVGEGMAYLDTLKRAGVPVVKGWRPVRAEGGESVESLTLARVDRQGSPVNGTERRFPVDAVGMNFGFTANSELARMAGAAERYDVERGGWLPVMDAFGRTDAPCVFVAGDGAGLRGAPNAAVEGRIIGAAAAAAAGGVSDDLGSEMRSALAERRRHLAFQKAVGETLLLPQGLWWPLHRDMTVCRCECVTAGRILDAAVARWDDSLDAVKRNTRAGMGLCGGRSCLRAVAEYSFEADPAAMRARPPARPVTIGALANRDEA